jgi:DNA topoisomerase-1
MISEFYFPFHEQITGTLEGTKKISGEKVIGTDPQSGLRVLVKIGRYGPMAQIGEGEGGAKPKFAALKKGQSIDTITVEEALELFKLPRMLGLFQEKEVTVSIGRFGPYVRHNSVFYSLAKTDDPLTVTLERALEVITLKQQEEKNRIIREFTEEPDLRVLNGRYGAYISYNKQNYRLPKGTKPEELTLEECRKIVTETQPTKSARGRKKK